MTLVAAMLLGGCSAQREVPAPPVEMPEAFSKTGRAELSDQWWTAFDDAQLNALVDSSLTSNLSLRSTWQRLQAAQAVAEREAAALYPAVDADALGEITRGGASDEERLSLGLNASYEVDLWGRLRSRADAERYQARATRSDYQAAALSLTGELARTVYALVTARQQLALVDEQVETNAEVLELLENRLAFGQIPGVDVLRQRQLVQATYEQRAVVAARVERLEQQVAVLLGRSPVAAPERIPEALPALPPLPETGVPVELVRRRPDVQSALFRVRAADSELAAAISSQYPRLTLTAGGSTSATSADQLFREWVYSFAGSLLAPIFYGGELRAEVERAEAVRRERLYTYGQVVLVAFREVEEALTQEAAQRERILRLERQITLGQEAYDQLRIQYFNGTGSYLEVLTALDDLQQLRRDLLSARFALVESRIALYGALAGSIEAGRAS